MTIKYLACPYTHKEATVRNSRAAMASRAAAFFMQQGHVIYSPITHGHNIEPYLKSPFETDAHSFWMPQCLPFVEAASELWVLCLPGWLVSKGVLEEIEFAQKLKKPIKYFIITGNFPYDLLH